jgi:deoxyribodipyrimidine photo-lyase
VHDHPALAAAARAGAVVPLFVVDDALLASGFASPNRARFLCQSLADLDAALRRRGGALVVRRGDVVREAVALARAVRAGAISASADVSQYASRRQQRLARACGEAGLALRLFPGVTVVPPGALTPADGDHFRVFTPYWRRWRTADLRGVEPPPGRIALPAGVHGGRLPRAEDLARGDASPELPAGGETAGRARLRAWLRSGLARYGERHDDLAADGTSRLSPYLHFGCLSAREVLEQARGREGAEPFVRQLCWRDFHHQVVAARPDLTREDYRPRGDRWRRDARRLAAWKAGRTGYPVVDAAMRQLAREGFMPDRARLIAASFLTKDLYLDWRLGAQHFLDLLVDGDVAANAGNWQWVAGTGNDTRPNRVLNPLAQARRFDPEGRYVRRHVPELAAVAGGRVHEPWALHRAARRALDYPERIVDHAGAAARFRAARAGAARNRRRQEPAPPRRSASRRRSASSASDTSA